MIADIPTHIANILDVKLIVSVQMKLDVFNEKNVKNVVINDNVITNEIS
ncbi:hypothetical protein H9M94_01920 [Mycoplasma sp. Pen4]|nr:hypothetical protein [Mycoplasma sp. Pen4]QNM93368.1 hypothetical protein H9M94_01920 [Mycoplasma sp. Pen4]